MCLCERPLHIEIDRYIYNILKIAFLNTSKYNVQSLYEKEIQDKRLIAILTTYPTEELYLHLFRGFEC
jgi:hypothetical protein